MHRESLKVAREEADDGDMDYQAPPSLLERMRTEQVVRRIDRQAFGFTTRDFHRRARLQQVAFVFLLLLSVAGAAFLLTG